MPHYPSELERLVTLRDGARVHIRPIRPDDRDRLIDLHSRLSRQTTYQRFFTVMRRLPPDWAQMLANVDYRQRLALVAEHDGPRGVELIGVGRYEPTDREDTAEVAFVVQDAWQGQGLGKVLLHEILSAAEARGIRRFRAWVLADNSRMLDLFRRFTDIQARTLEDGVVEIVFTRRRTPAAAAHPAPCTRPR
ncbi:MAG TPA: GNAT family N-acetyltransferase [Methylomirabilota bacterium]|nr:GNAT family N-acetyltransferase [Methylomirabilota bacterium]